MKNQQSNSIKVEVAKSKRINRKTNKAWKMISSSRKYKRILAKEYSRHATDDIRSELYDGLFLELDEPNRDKSCNVQKRILRRIVEKRQAKATFKAIGRTQDLFFAHVTNKCTSNCFERLRRYNCFSA